jgi:hypothetical protein
MERRRRDNRRVDVRRAQLRRVGDRNRDAVSLGEPLRPIEGAVHQRNELNTFVSRQDRQMERLRDRSAADERYAHGIGATAVECRSDTAATVFVRRFMGGGS